MNSTARSLLRRPGFKLALSEPRSFLEILPAQTPKRVVSVTLAERLAALLLSTLLYPLFLAVAIAIKLEDPKGTVFYRQDRVGHNRRQNIVDRRASSRGIGPALQNGDRRKQSSFGRTFSIWKFRTMVQDAEARTGPVWARKHDPRITRVGRVLRSTRIDELPQLANIVAGDMRLIGPRPERPHFVVALATKVPGYIRRLGVPPGITGLAQVERAYDEDVEDVRKKLEYDLFYIEHHRPILDLKILVKTCHVVLARRGSR